MAYFYIHESVQNIVLQRFHKFGYLKDSWVSIEHIHLRLLFKVKGYGVARERESRVDKH